MNQRNRSSVRWRLSIAALGVVVAAVSLGVWWMPASRQWLANLKAAPASQAESPVQADEHAKADHDAHTCTEDHDHSQEEDKKHPETTRTAKQDTHDDDDHDHASTTAYDHVHDAANALVLSRQATATLGLDLQRVELHPFARTINIPATIVQRPGTSQVQVVAVFTGTISRIHHAEGEAVEPGMPLFDLRLTHEELVEAQADFLRAAEELDVVQREVARLDKIAQTGAIPGKTLLEREYEKQKLEASLRSHRQRLLLHGLPEEKVDEILSKRQLLQELTIRAPEPPSDDRSAKRSLEIRSLKVEKGQQVAAGDPLCVLTDYAILYAQGKAFETDLAKLTTAVHNGWPVTAVFELDGNPRQLVEELKILYLANEVDAESRALHFYVPLPNELTRNTRTGSGQRFIDWRFRPGQRARLLVPVEPTTPRIVLPVEAVAQDGPESYVFEFNQGHFDRRSVHVEYRDQDRVVIANDGSVKPGAKVAVAGAYQLQLATKNKTAAPVDPHAGHNH